MLKNRTKGFGKHKTRIFVAIVGFFNIYILILGHSYFGWSFDLCKLGIEIGSGVLAASFIVGRSASHFANKFKENNEEDI